ncbi:hypothetical protein GA830_03035 [Mesorhizobium sp. NBSH29]|uniref:hypothetical protein n=1 Tax=Mesorhizobium sp. NBSH29 TaxID=2654249 RepID=UPI0018967BD0|nr:hypothetical protein [Mesorhizobium sp. NBSH29]QPC85820.1 hypothetical protein GA830_03035 [Mesorhizobium sp. NBSH29]
MPQAAKAEPGFLMARWRGLVPLDRLFWRDMLLIGSALNAVASVVALLMLEAKLPLAAVLAVHFAPLVSNIFLFFAVWKTAAAQPGPLALMAQIVAAIWLVVATVV